MTQEKIMAGIGLAIENTRSILSDGGIDPAAALDAGSAESRLLAQLMKLVSENRAGSAEDMLFDELHAAPTLMNLKAALLFYVELSKLTQQQQEDNDFYMGEVLDGLTDACSVYLATDENAVG